MRNREEILLDQSHKGIWEPAAIQIALLTEVLLDIRDLLQGEKKK